MVEEWRRKLAPRIETTMTSKFILATGGFDTSFATDAQDYSTTEVGNYEISHP